VNQVAETLRKAADLCAKGWTQGVMARDAKGKEVPASSPDAVCWCADGAMLAASGDGGIYRDGHTYRPARAASYSAFGCGPFEFNDAPNRTADEVIRALRAAADAVEAQ